FFQAEDGIRDDLVTGVQTCALPILRLACNQATNRDPVVDYDEPQIRAALERLGRREWTRLASGAGSRAIKYRHLLDEALRLGGEIGRASCRERGWDAVAAASSERRG